MNCTDDLGDYLLKDYICIIGKFGQLAYHQEKFVRELRSLVGENAFPWTDRQALFSPATSDLSYVFDEPMQAIAKQYEDCGNEDGFLSLIEITYNYDSFGASDGLYGKIVIRCDGGIAARESRDLISGVLIVLRSHVPLEEGQKVKLVLGVKGRPDDPKVPSSLKELWMKVIVQRQGKITQHILFGEKGDAKKVHVFCRAGESPTYENTPNHLAPTVAPFRQISGVVVKDGITHTYHLEREEPQPNKPKKPTP